MLSVVESQMEGAWIPEYHFEKSYPLIRNTHFGLHVVRSQLLSCLSHYIIWGLFVIVSSVPLSNTC